MSRPTELQERATLEVVAAMINAGAEKAAAWRERVTGEAATMGRFEQLPETVQYEVASAMHPLLSHLMAALEQVGAESGS